MRQEIWQVWILDNKKIASFHSVEGFHDQIFCYHDHLLCFLQELSERGYRPQ